MLLLSSPKIIHALLLLCVCPSCCRQCGSSVTGVWYGSHRHLITTTAGPLFVLHLLDEVPQALLLGSGLLGEGAHLLYGFGTGLCCLGDAGGIGAKAVSRWKVVVMCSLPPLDQLAGDEPSSLVGGEFTTCDRIGHGSDVPGVFVAGAVGIGATKGILLGVDGVILLHGDDDGLVLLAMGHRGHRPFCSN